MRNNVHTVKNQNELIDQCYFLIIILFKEDKLGPCKYMRDEYLEIER
jgi:hypothetical protein